MSDGENNDRRHLALCSAAHLAQPDPCIMMLWIFGFIVRFLVTQLYSFTELYQHTTDLDLSLPYLINIYVYILDVICHDLKVNISLVEL